MAGSDAETLAVACISKPKPERVDVRLINQRGVGVERRAGDLRGGPGRIRNCCSAVMHCARRYRRRPADSAVGRLGATAVDDQPHIPESAEPAGEDSGICRCVERACPETGPRESLERSARKCLHRTNHPEKPGSLIADSAGSERCHLARLHRIPVWECSRFPGTTPHLPHRVEAPDLCRYSLGDSPVHCRNARANVFSLANPTDSAIRFIG
jgi:hypothetical protein